MSHIYLFLQMHMALSHWCGWRPLASAITRSGLDPHMHSSRTSCCCCPVTWRSCSFGSAGQACPPADHKWGKYLGGSTQKPRIWAREVVELVSLLALLCLHHQGKFSSQLTWCSSHQGAGLALLSSHPGLLSPSLPRGSSIVLPRRGAGPTLPSTLS